jgi:predicted DCC family thiol-disulfide oxidoreductase YuxK
LHLQFFQPLIFDSNHRYDVAGIRHGKLFRMKDEWMGEPQDIANTGAVHPIMLYDGVCGLCNRMVQFVLKRDWDGIFHFAALQSQVAESILKLHGKNAADLNTVYVVLNFDPADPEKSSGEILERSNAVLYMMRRLGGFWAVSGNLLRMIPRNVRDWGYSIVARIRYRVFGKYDTCTVPNAETRARFLGL